MQGRQIFKGTNDCAPMLLCCRWKAASPCHQTWQPRCFRGYTGFIPVTYKANRRTWMTKDMFSECWTPLTTKWEHRKETFLENYYWTTVQRILILSCQTSYLCLCHLALLYTSSRVMPGSFRPSSWNTELSLCVICCWKWMSLTQLQSWRNLWLYCMPSSGWSMLGIVCSHPR